MGHEQRPITVDEIMPHLTDRGQVEVERALASFHLTAERARSAQLQQRITELEALEAELLGTQDDEPEFPEAYLGEG